MKKLIWSIALIVLFLPMAGCLSITAHNCDTKILKRPYDVTFRTIDALATPDTWSDSSNTNRIEEFDGAIKGIFWSGLLLDMPFEIVFDTLYFPYDLLMWNNYERW